jgi:hypothetical protein
MLNLHDNHQTYMDEKKPYTLLMGNNYYYMITDKISLTCANSNITYLAENYAMDKIPITFNNYIFDYTQNNGNIYKEITFLQSSSAEAYFPPKPIPSPNKWKDISDSVIKNNCTTYFVDWLETDPKYNTLKTYPEDWIKYIENIKDDIASILKKDYGILYRKDNSYNIFTFSKGIYPLTQQVWLPPYTILEGAGNPNVLTNPRKGTDITNLTIFQGQAITPKPQYTKPSWINENSPDVSCANEIKTIRIGFLMNNNTILRNFIAIGDNSNRGACSTGTNEAGLCGGGIIELPGCATEYLGPSGQCGNGTEIPLVGVTFPSETCYSGLGRGISNVLVENVRLNILNKKTYSRAGFWSSQSVDNTPHTNITLRQIFCAKTERDSVNIHGKVNNFLGEDLYFEGAKDDSYAVWGVNDSKCSPQESLGDDICFNRVYAIQDMSDSNGTCAQVFGSKKVTFNKLTCCYNNRDPGNAVIFRKLQNFCAGIPVEDTNIKVGPARFYFNGNKCPSNNQQWGKVGDISSTCTRQTGGLCTPRDSLSQDKAGGCIFSSENTI